MHRAGRELPPTSCTRTARLLREDVVIRGAIAIRVVRGMHGLNVWIWPGPSRQPRAGGKLGHVPRRRKCDIFYCEAGVPCRDMLATQGGGPLHDPPCTAAQFPFDQIIDSSARRHVVASAVHGLVQRAGAPDGVETLRRSRVARFTIGGHLVRSPTPPAERIERGP
jgi:hypothetical protein